MWHLVFAIVFIVVCCVLLYIIIQISQRDNNVRGAYLTAKIYESISSTSNVSVSPEERKRYLEELQSETTDEMIAALVYLAVLAVLGLVGNTLVILVYTRRLHWSATAVLIMTLSGFDLVANVIAIPGEIFNIFHKWDFNNPALCKARLFCSAFTTISSGMILVAIAVVRYRRMCYPHKWQITAGHAKTISVVIFAFGLLFSAPHAILYGLQIRETPRKGIIAFVCGTEDNYKNTRLPLLNYVFLLMLYIVCSVIMIVLYILIGVTACKRVEFTTDPLLSMLDTPIETINQGSDALEMTVNQNESNCTRCISPDNKNMDAAISDEAATQSARNDKIKMKPFHVGNEADEHPVQCNARAFTDCIEVRTPAVHNFFVNLQMKTPGKTDSANHEENHLNNTDNGNAIQKGSSGEVTRTSGIRMVGSNNCNIKIRTIKSNLGDIVSNFKYTEKRIHAFLNRDNILDAVKTTDTTVSTLHFKEHSVLTGSICDKNDLNLKSVEDTDRHPPQSIEAVANEIPNKDDPLSMFKWLGVIYCPKGKQTTFDPNCVQRELSTSLRLPLNNGLLQQTGWMRASVVEAMESQDSISKESQHEGFLGFSTSVDKSQAGCSYSVGFSESATTGTAPTDLNKNVLQRRFHEKFFKRMSIITMGGFSPNTPPAVKTTTILFIITALFIFSYLPHLVLMFVKFLSPEVIKNLPLVACIFYHLIARSFFLNSAVNPIIYSLSNSNFRRECKQVFRITNR